MLTELWMTIVLSALPGVGETRREAWPDGSPRAEYEVEVLGEGHEERSGHFRSWHENGQLESEGNFADDRETGRWKFYHPNGERAAEGSFARGERVGSWETLHASGKKASKGRYDKGFRSGAWSFWDEDGKTDEANSGSYSTLEVTLADGRKLLGEALDGQPHGAWKSTWPNGAPMFEGTFARGKRDGAWIFHDSSGAALPLLSGVYEDEVLRGDAELEAPKSLPAPSTVEPGVFGWPAELPALEAELDSWSTMDAKALDDIQRKLASKGALPRWVTAGVKALPVVVRRLLACDPATPAGRAAIGLLEQRVLQPLCGKHTLVPLGPKGPASEADAREFQCAWAGLWAATADDPWFWTVELPFTPVAGADEILRERPFALFRAQLEPPAPPPALFAQRFEARDKGADGPLQAALAWLEKNQSADGHWSASIGIKKPKPHFDTGVTALATLALLGAGRSPNSVSVSAAIAWLLNQQSAVSGEIPAHRISHDWLYNHMLSTLALCEAQALQPCEAIRAPTQKAVDVIFAARNPFGAWRYDLPPVGESDTSVTAWAVSTLFAARAAGFEGDFEAAFAGGRAWIDEVTEPVTGRIGYDGVASLSGRSPENENFPREKGEAMTGAGLFARRLLGVPADDVLAKKQLKLLGAKPPLWDPKGFGIDEYYFYYGAEALALCGALKESGWEKALEGIAHAQTGNAGERGSWDPVGAWAYCGGRVYSTALLSLALEAPYRYALPDVPEEGKKGKRK